MTFVVKKNGRTVTKKALKSGFSNYEDARQAARREIRAAGGNSDRGLAANGFSVVQKQTSVTKTKNPIVASWGIHA